MPKFLFGKCNAPDPKQNDILQPASTAPSTAEQQEAPPPAAGQAETAAPPSLALRAEQPAPPEPTVATGSGKPAGDGGGGATAPAAPPAAAPPAGKPAPETPSAGGGGGSPSSGWYEIVSGGGQDSIQEAVEASMDRLGADVRPWDKGSMTFVTQLQEALRNHGHVDLMKTDTKQRVAVKRMPTSWVRAGPKDFREQYPTASEQPWFDMGVVSYLNDIGFPYVCKLGGVFRSSDETFVVSSFCTEGDLFSWCDRDSIPPTSINRERVMMPLVTQMIAAIRYLHDLGIAHRDLSLENIMVTKAPHTDTLIQIIDFGMATLSRTVRREVRGKQSYQAPEMHTESEYDTFLADIFALGVVIFAMAAQDYPWTSTKRKGCQLFEYVAQHGLRRFLEKRRVRKGDGNEFLIHALSPQFTQTIEAMLQIKHMQRACLGERCFTGDGRNRANVWTMPWLEGLEPPVTLGNASLNDDDTN